MFNDVVPTQIFICSVTLETILSRQFSQAQLALFTATTIWPLQAGLRTKYHEAESLG